MLTRVWLYRKGSSIFMADIQALKHMRVNAAGTKVLTVEATGPVHRVCSAHQHHGFARDLLGCSLRTSIPIYPKGPCSYIVYMYIYIYIYSDPKAVTWKPLEALNPINSMSICHIVTWTLRVKYWPRCRVTTAETQQNCIAGL